MNVDERAEALASDLGADEEEVREDLENLVSYSVPIDEAEQSLRRKYGDGSGGDAPGEKSIDEVTTDDSSVSVTARVLTVGTRTIRYEGDEYTIYEGELADGTGVVDYTAWEAFGLDPGDTVTVTNAGVREWEGEPELNLQESTSVAVEDDPLEVPYRIGGDRRLVDLEPGDRGRAVEVQVVEIEARTVDGRDGPTEILSGVVADETARLPFTDWNPHSRIEAGATLRLEDVHVREFRGVPQVTLSEFTTVHPLDRDIEAPEEAPRLRIDEAVSRGGMYDLELVGHVIDLREGSGLIQRCPDCNRVVQNGQCRSHGEVDGVDDLRVRAILDDGTGTATAVLDRDLTEDVYGGSLEDALEDARDAMDKEVVTERIAERIVGREYRVRGSLSVDEYGATLDATEYEPVSEDPEGRARALLDEYGAAGAAGATGTGAN